MKNTFFSNRFRWVLLSVVLFGVTGLALAITYPTYCPVSSARAMMYVDYSADQGLPSLAMQSHTMQGIGSAYASSVYEPFTTELPSMDSDPSNQDGNGRHGHLRNGKIIGPDINPGQESPVGEPWILLLFAALFAVRPVRKKMNKERVIRE